jgi:hypothetical protein
MVGSGLDEDGAPFFHRNLLVLHLKQAGALENDVYLVILVGLLPVGFGGDQDVDPELQARRLVDDLVTTARLPEPRLCSGDLEVMHSAELTHDDSQTQDVVWAARVPNEGTSSS